MNKELSSRKAILDNVDLEISTSKESSLKGSSLKPKIDEEISLKNSGDKINARQSVVHFEEFKSEFKTKNAKPTVVIKNESLTFKMHRLEDETQLLQNEISLLKEKLKLLPSHIRHASTSLHQNDTRHENLIDEVSDTVADVA